MCGIAGIFDTRGAGVDRDRLVRMTGALEHRGPDESGVWVEGAAGFGHRRLSIIDLASGQQPMSTPDGALWITFNGEIYNFPALRRELATAGAMFSTKSDTEVLLHLFARHGAAMLDRLIGMFALAIFDTRRQELFLARDRLGKKPLFYFFQGSTFAFASELQALRHAPAFPTAVRTEAIGEYLTHQYVPCPHTIFHAVHKLPPGTFLRVSAGQSAKPTPQRYWALRFRPDASLSIDAAAEELRRLLADAVRLRLVADVPVGAFLSGGVDSTCIAGLMADARRDQALQTFTIGFADGAYDERKFAAVAARRFATEHHERVVDPKDFAAVRRLVRHHGEPYADASMLPTYLLCRFAREKVKVVVSGDGADELFGGYERYQALGLARWLDAAPAGLRRALHVSIRGLLRNGGHERAMRSRLRRFLALAAAPPTQRYFHAITHFPAELRAAVYGPRLLDTLANPMPAYLDHWLEAATTTEDAAKASEVDVHTYLLNDILTKVDISSMAASLEVRSPFLDHRVVEFAAALPWAFKQRWFERKRILLRACADLLPPVIRHRRKKGFGVPLARWLREDWQPLLREILLDPACRRRGFFAHDGIAHLIEEHVAGEADRSCELWSLMLFELWCQEWDIR